ncbi:chymotrypsin-like elastase family member 2A [Palaemon carinicauda]|uniref:chymotrypsin-like elastase family member 2A n=1 Tax=Palaemon carinicauda TaxID=392227 RepID=UPI0035B590BB
MFSICLEVLVSATVVFVVVRASAGQDKGTTCSTGSIPEGRCVLVSECPSLLSLSKELPIHEFLIGYGCGTDSDGNIRFCCAIEDPPVTEESIPLKPRSRCGSPASHKGLGFPYVVGLGTLRDGHFVLASCGGVIVSESWILTRASCLDSITHVDLRNENGTRYVSVTEKRPYQWFDSTDGPEGDIGMLRLEDPLHFNDFLQPICLPDEAEYDGSNPMIVATISQSSSSEPLYNFQIVTVFTRDECLQKVHDRYWDTISSDTICANKWMISNSDAIRESRVLFQDDVSSAVATLEGIGGFETFDANNTMEHFIRVYPYVTWINSVL